MNRNHKQNLQINFLGTVRFTWKGRPLTDFATQKVLGLFCYLIDHSSESISRDALMSMFWSESPESQARYNLRYALWNIRKAFQHNNDTTDPFISDRNNVQMNPEIHLVYDVTDFLHTLDASEGDRSKQLLKAVELYKGPFLHTFSVRNSPDWEEWVSKRRNQLIERYHYALIELGNRYIEAGTPAKSVEYFMRGLSELPTWESAHEGLIRAYAAQGKVATAVRQFDLYREMMRKEFNAPPHPDVIAIIDSLRGAPTATAAAVSSRDVTDTTLVSGKSTQAPAEQTFVQQTEREREETASGKPTKESQALPLVAPIPRNSEEMFIGREEELNTLKRIEQEVLQGSGQVVLISGEMGIGKTSLLTEYFSRLSPEIALSYGESLQIASGDPNETIEQLFGRFELEPRVPFDLKDELKALQIHQASIEGSIRDESEFLGSCRKWVLKLASQVPVVIAFDDLHWASEMVLSFFASLAQEVRKVPLLLIGVFRSYEAKTESVIASTLVPVARTGRLWRIELKQFTEDEIKLLIEAKARGAVSGLDEEKIAKLVRYTGGVPLFAVELATFLYEGHQEILDSPILNDQPVFTTLNNETVVPPLMKQIALLRLQSLSEQQIELLRFGSLLVGDFSASLLCALTGMEPEAAEDALIELEYRNFLQHIEQATHLRFHFSHQMIKLAIAETISSLERRKYYRTILSTIDATHDDSGIEARAYYKYHSGERIEATSDLMKSAQQWLRLGDRTRSLQYSKIAYSIALELFSSDVDRLSKTILDHASILIELGMIKSAIDVYTNLIERIEADPGSVTGDLSAKREQLREMLKTAPNSKTPQAPKLSLVMTKRSLAKIRSMQGDLDHARALLADAELLLETIPEDAATIHEHGMLLMVKGHIAMAGGEYEDAVKLLTGSLELLKSSNALEEQIESYLLRAESNRLMGYPAKARKVLNEALNLAKHADSDEQGKCHHALGLLSHSEGDFRTAVVQLQHAIDFLEKRNPLDPHFADYQIDLARTYYQLGDIDTSRKLVLSAEATYHADDNLSSLANVELLRAHSQLP